jgi:DNA-binding NtrC family response regulator
VSHSRPKVLIIDDQLASDADLREEFCRTQSMVEISLKGEDDKSAQFKDRDVAAVFVSAQRRQEGRVENSLEEAHKAVAAGWPHHKGWRWALILLDLRFDSSKSGTPEDEYFGLKILDDLVSSWPDDDRPGNSDLPIVVLSSIERKRYGANANRAGAAQYIEKARLDREVLRTLLDRHGLLEDRRKLIFGEGHPVIFGRSLPLLKALRHARRAASEARGNILILGEQGTGKTLLARFIHELSPRRSAPFQSLTVGPGMDPQMLKAQLFGFWYGAYTPVDKSEAGLAERAHGGTLFLDEIANLPMAAHQELLEYCRLTDTGLRRFNRLGTYPTAPKSAIRQAVESVRGQFDTPTETMQADVFFLSATNKPIDNSAYRRDKGFPDDLFIRLGQEYHQPIRFPNLRERKEDIVPLFQRFLEEESCKNHGTWPRTIGTDVQGALQDYSWPGNVAQLAGVAREVERATRQWEEVHAHHLPAFQRDNVGNVEAPIRSKGRTAASAEINNSIDDVRRALELVTVRDSRNELEGALRGINRAYGAFIERLLSAALDFTRDRSGRGKDTVLGDLSPTRAMNLLLEESMKTDKAADEIKRLVALLPEAPSASSDIGRVYSWAINLRRGGRRTSEKANK